jgi:hypothetical protein
MTSTTSRVGLKQKVGSLFIHHDAQPLALYDMDYMFEFQQTLRNPKQLGCASFAMMGLGNVKSTMKVTSKLNDLGILLSSRNSGGKGVDDIVVTDALPPDFSKKMRRVLPIYHQKRMMMILFFWAEELMRWRLIEDEINEVKLLIEEERQHGSREVGHLEVRKMELEGLWRLKPSLRLRREEGREALPDYYPAEE